MLEPVQEKQVVETDILLQPRLLAKLHVSEDMAVQADIFVCVFKSGFGSLELFSRSFFFLSLSLVNFIKEEKNVCLCN